MLFKEIIAVYSENHTKTINSLCVQSRELLNVTAGSTIVNTVLQRAPVHPNLPFVWYDVLHSGPALFIADACHNIPYYTIGRPGFESRKGQNFPLLHNVQIGCVSLSLLSKVH
jgi:hypothetical protein